MQLQSVIHRPFELLEPAIGASADELKLVFTFLLSYPLAGVLKRIPDTQPERKNIFVVATSLFYLVGLFDLWDGLQTIAISAGGAYLIAKFLRGSPFMPWVGFAFLMGHMSLVHIARQVENDPTKVEISATQMVLVMKLSAFCWNVADGCLPPEELSDLQKDRMLTELPSLLDYAGYVLFFPSLMVGPSFDFAEYRRWIDTSMFDVPANVDPSKKPPVRKKRRIPRSGTPAAWKAAGGAGWIGLFLFLSGKYGHGQLLQDSYMEYGFLRRLWILHMVGFTTRMKYYGVWSLTEGACILAGLGYNGVDPTTGRVSWNRLQNIDPWVVETAQNPRAYLAGWNMNTNYWLRNYVYLRVTPRGKKPGFRASMITFVTSALWHGFYPGYYLTFVFASLVQTVSKNFRRYVRPLFLDPATGAPRPSKQYYDMASYLTTQATFSFATIPFLVLTFSESLQVWARVYFYALAGTLLSMAFWASPLKNHLVREQEKRQTRAGVKMTRTISQESIGREPVLGLSADPHRDLSEAMAELRADMAARQKKIA